MLNIVEVVLSELSSSILKGPEGSAALRIHEIVCESEAEMGGCGWNEIENALAPTEKVELKNRSIRCYIIIDIDSIRLTRECRTSQPVEVESGTKWILKERMKMYF